MKTFNFLVLIFLLSVSCNIADRKNNSFTLIPSQSILSFPIDSTTSNISTGLVSFENYLINVNWKVNSLQFYGIQSQKLEKEIFFPYEGPQGVGALFGIQVKSLDSIFLYPQISNLITLTDFNGKINNRIEYKNPYIYTNAFVHNTYFLSPPLIRNNKLLVKTHIQGNYKAMTEEKLKISKMAYSIDLTNGNIELGKLNYPEGYLSKGLKHFEPSLVFQPDFTVFSLFGDHRVFKQNQDGTLEIFDGQSQFLDESLPLFPVAGERLDTQKYLTASSRYESLVYDPFREVYYRFAYPTLAIKTEEDLSLLRENPGPFVIQVFDNELKMLTESYFEGGIYFPNNSFITKEGLYISINNPENRNAHEDLFQFERIDLAELD
ncbi:DUF4221 family protein [Algoriphagus sp.]|jgi:hypothetical protein|uniref:DUF4221 family protein n=1 Tax=Algoriphagus sp. TaxID=1872435 RepID=UPI0027158E96|nr:DUF4221 family protein [Algoriphagus sp.]MDO8968537.1 DUF4221 family protein [Algoriphagus sp.]MDP3200686.1 DUF4221 family protein [Algoriphagus sp.]